MSRYTRPKSEEIEEVKTKEKTKTSPVARPSKRAMPFPVKSATESVIFGEEDRIVQPKDPHFLRIALVGAPNAGKSTLMNALAGEKISAVSNMAQTTRNQIVGLHTQKNVQLAFMDTPGVIHHSQAKSLPRSILVSALQGLRSCNLAMLVIDGLHPKPETEDYVMKYLEEGNFTQKNRILVLNKIDAGTRTRFEQIAEGFAKKSFFEEVFLVSALKGDGLPDLRDYLLSKALPAMWEYAGFRKTDLSQLQILEETIRDSLFQLYRLEVPYIVRQQNIGWTELPNNGLRIDQVLLVDKEAQKIIILGPGGNLIRTLRSRTTDHLSRVFNRRVELFLNVKVEK